MNRRQKAVAALVAATSVYSFGFHRWRIRPISFDRASWLAEERLEDEGNVRNRMRESVVRRLRSGMRIEDVTAMLGDQEYDDRPDARPFLRYVLKKHWSYRWNGATESLLVDFDEEKRLRTVEIISTEW